MIQPEPVLRSALITGFRWIWSGSYDPRTSMAYRTAMVMVVVVLWWRTHNKRPQVDRLKPDFVGYTSRLHLICTDDVVLACNGATSNAGGDAAITSCHNTSNYMRKALTCAVRRCGETTNSTSFVPVNPQLPQPAGSNLYRSDCVLKDTADLVCFRKRHLHIICKIK